MSEKAVTSKSRLWILSELYYPEESATGYYVTGLAEGLAGELDVRVLCAQPTYAARGTVAPKDEVYRGVHIHRCAATALDKDILLFRFVNLLTISVSIFVNALFRVRSGDQVFVVTNPPTLPFVAAIVCRLRRARLILRIEDVYPEAIAAAGILRSHSVVFRLLQRLHRRLYESVNAIVVLGRDMQALVQRKAPSSASRIRVIPNWADLDQIHPLPRTGNPLLQRLGLDEKFVVQYSGNMGRTHDLESLLEVATRIVHHTDIHFLFIGAGAKEAILRSTLNNTKLSNVTLLPPQKRTDLCISLNASDVAVISFVPGMVGVSVPSRMYNVLAAGKPIIAIAGKDSELAMLVREADVGWVVEPGDIAEIQKALLEAYSCRHEFGRIADRARALVENRYSYRTIMEHYRTLFNSIGAHVLDKRSVA